jgi:hypothetical protein
MGLSPLFNIYFPDATDLRPGSLSRLSLPLLPLLLLANAAPGSAEDQGGYLYSYLDT